MPSQQEYYQVDLDRFLWRQKIESAICFLANTSDLMPGVMVVRNEKGWRDNERILEYSWHVTISRSFVGNLTLFALKFNENTFRDIRNKDELIVGILELDNKGQITSRYKDSSDDLSDPIADIRHFNLFDANNGITLDGTSYDISIRAYNIQSQISLNNPNSDSWKQIERHIYALGQKLVGKSGNHYYQEFFTK